MPVIFERRNNNLILNWQGLKKKNLRKWLRFRN